MIMKIWKYILSAAALLALGACNHDADEMVIPTRNLDIAAHNAVVVNDVTAAEEFTLTWSAAKFGVQTEVEYTVSATVDGGQAVTLGTTTNGEKEFICYIGYILYEDGTTWGTPTIDHKTVITRNERITVSFKEVEEFAWRD
jgi:hypothetical protein